MIKRYLISAVFFLIGLFTVVESFGWRRWDKGEMVIGIAFWLAIPVVWLWKRKPRSSSSPPASPDSTDGVSTDNAASPTSLPEPFNGNDSTVA